MADDPTGTRGVSPLMIFVASFRRILGAALDGVSGYRGAVICCTTGRRKSFADRFCSSSGIQTTPDDLRTLSFGCLADSLQCMLYWMMASARFSTEGGMVRPIVLAEPALITSSNSGVGPIGRSAGRVPLRTRSTYNAPCRAIVRPSAP